MESPTAIERRYRSLLHDLRSGGSPSSRVFRIHQFLRPLLDGETGLSPWLPEIIEHLLLLIPRAEFDGTDPHDLAELLNEMTISKATRPEISTLAGFDPALELLGRAAALQYAYAGEPALALQHLGVPKPQATAIPLPETSHGEPLLRQYRKMDTAILENGSHAAEWSRLLAHWQSLVESTRDGVVVPVVEVRVDGSTCSRAGLRTVAFDAFDVAGGRSDRIQADLPVAGVHETAASTFAPAINAARSYVAMGHHPGLMEKPVSCRITFRGEQGLHSGASANLALATLAACRFTHILHRRDLYDVLPSVAMSGSVDPTGVAIAMDPTTLQLKVHAVFFSWISVLVVPSGQIDLVKEALLPLQERYPRRRLGVIGVQDLQEIFFDRRLTRLTHIGPLRDVARQIWTRRRPIALTAFLALLLIIARLWYGPIDKRAATWGVENESIVVRNAGGSVLDRIPIGMSTARSAAPGPTVARGRNLAGIVDVDGDSTPELVWARSSDSSPDASSEVLCKTPGEDSVRWAVTLQRRLVFPGSPDVTSGVFQWYRIDCGDYDGDGANEIYVLAKSPGFASLVLKLDGRTGTETGSYVHAGHLNDMCALDLNADGVRELVLCGVNNGLRSACLVVLDPTNMNGYSPFATGYELDSVPPGREYAYMLLPRTIVGETFRRQVKYNIAETISKQDSGRVLEVCIRDAFVNAQAKEDNLSSTVFIAFDRSLQPLNIRTGDDFDSVYLDLLNRGAIKRQTPFEYAREYIRSLSGQPWIRGTARSTIRPNS
jgi:hypothetical protein